MTYDEYSELSNKLNELALYTLHKLQILTGFCESSEIEEVSASMLYEQLTEIRDKQSQLVKIADKYTTNIGNMLLNSTESQM